VWKLSCMGHLLQKVKDTSSTSRQARSGRPRTARMQENVDIVGDLLIIIFPRYSGYSMQVMWANLQSSYWMIVNMEFLRDFVRQNW